MKDIIEKIGIQVAEMSEAFNAINQPRSDFALKNFVIGQHDTAPMAYQQCVVEMRVKWVNIRRQFIALKKRMGEAIGLCGYDEEIAKLDIEEMEYSLIGAFREFETLYAIWKSFSKQYTHADIQAAQEEYWLKRLSRQAELDIAATGRIMQSNLDAMRQAGVHRLEKTNGAVHYCLQPPVREWSLAQPVEDSQYLQRGTSGMLASGAEADCGQTVGDSD